MYADRYFPARYFPNRYFGTTADAGAPALLSVYANPRSDAATIGDYDGDDAGHIAAYARAMLAGSDFLYAIRKWDLLEATEGVYDFSYFDRLADNSSTLPLHLSIALLDSDAAKHLPSDLASTDLDAAGTISAFNAMIAALATALGADASRVQLVILGNEVDYYIAAGTVATRRAELIAFLQGVVPTVQAQFPNATVSSCFSKEAVADWATNSYALIQAEVDDPAFTLQWFDSSTFAANALDSTLFDHLAALQSAIGAVEWHLVEAGYPSDTLPGGSEANQATFVTAIADTVRTAYTPYLQSIQFTWMNDLAAAILEAAPPNGYGLTLATNPHAVFGSLGLMTLDGQFKSAWPVLVGYLGGDPGDELVTLEIVTTSLQNGYDGVPYSQTIQAEGGTAPYSFAVTSGALPDGMSLNAGTGAITGTPTVQDAFAFTITVTDDVLDTDDQAFEVEITTAPLEGSQIGEFKVYGGEGVTVYFSTYGGVTRVKVYRG